MHVAVLGPVEVLDDGVPVDAGTPKQRAILAALVLHRPRAVAVDALIDLVWGDDPPPSPLSSLHGYVSGLRRVVEPRRAARERASVLVTVPPGYALRLPDDDVDATRFAAAVDDVHRRLVVSDGSVLPAVPLEAGPADLAAMAMRLREALGLWRGTPFHELDEAGAAAAERARLEELRLVAVEDLALLRLEFAEQATVAAELTALAQRHPLRERLWALRALALARSGRQADALEALQEIRRALGEELGVDPGPELRAVELAVLRQDLAVARSAGPAAAPVSIPSAPAAVAPSGAGPAVASADPRAWPLVGRDAELAALIELLAPAREGHTRLASLVGEPGIGKSRLVAELARHSADNGFAVLMGRCSDDEGAPPFWPWAGALRSLSAVLGDDVLRELAGADADRLAGLLPAVAGRGGRAPAAQDGADGASVDAERFRISDAVARLLAAAAGRQPLLVVLDDLHWADASSLRLLHHLAGHLADARVLIVVTRRPHPEPAGVLAEVVAGLGRRHALRLDLTGLSAAGVVELARAVTGEAPAAPRAASLHERTDGNPFFLVELLRLPGAEDIPAAVTDVVARRVARLPEATQELLRTAAVIGRQYDVDLLAAATAHDADTVLDDLDPALADGVVLEEAAPGRFRFAHALVRDVVYREQTATRRARRHAAVAAALRDDGDERLSEAARHWLAAGPAHAGVAWRTAARAARQARSIHGYEEGAALLAAARTAQAQDRSCGPADRYDLLMAHAEASRWIGDRDTQLDALAHACRAAEQLNDVDRLAHAAVGSADGSVWTVRDRGVVDQPAVAALRRVLRELPAGDSDLRCRALLTLAGELHYADAPRERDALAEEGLAMARRIGDPELLAWAAATAFVATWQAANAEQRWHHVDEALALTEERSGGDAARTHLLTFRAIVGMETGRVDEMWRDVAEARAGAERLRLLYPLVVLHHLELPWRAMQGRFAETEQLIAEADALSARTALPSREYFALSSLFVRIWQGRAGEFLPMARTMYEAAPALSIAFYLLVLVRAGHRDEAAAVLDRSGWEPDGGSWAATSDLAIGAHAAYVARRPQFAAEVYERLAPYAGRPATAGSGGALGPVDAFLALAAAAAGEHAMAARHADDAAALAAAWDLPVVTEWLAALRADGGF
ncbi:BTAD domain-containing putative transcriptional regulator [Dactylosporangium sucinum]|uniref:ATPase AAA n=1 Tax=Dactylosporangium sucinum TaxID=1424081 RepID=A0A917TS89_9ACTN|nr:BTAD domain-containing putative transcriptional regulator [Dactylosporangium sucinum]GGM35516.1 ATPase AAA [Dactylosporangium sucinum]